MSLAFTVVVLSSICLLAISLCIGVLLTGYWREAMAGLAGGSGLPG
jgi:hypothetical protein